MREGDAQFPSFKYSLQSVANMYWGTPDPKGKRKAKSRASGQGLSGKKNSAKKNPSVVDLRKEKDVIVIDSDDDDFEQPTMKVRRLDGADSCGKQNYPTNQSLETNAKKTNRKVRRHLCDDVNFDDAGSDSGIEHKTEEGVEWSCFECTFLNHAQIASCEMCGSNRNTSLTADTSSAASKEKGLETVKHGSLGEGKVHPNSNTSETIGKMGKASNRLSSREKY